ncbi:MAG: hypothetical protein ACRD3F_15075 [Acidobacteriaceae bacterium]
MAAMDVSEAQRLRAMEDVNRRLKLLVAKLSLHCEALKAAIQKKAGTCRGLRVDVALLAAEYRLSEPTACKLLEVERSSYRYEPRPDRNAELRDDLVKLARQKPRKPLFVTLNSTPEMGKNAQFPSRSFAIQERTSFAA